MRQADPIPRRSRWELTEAGATVAGRKTGLGSQAFTGVAGLAVAAVSVKLVKIVWVAATGRAVPEDPSDPSISTGEAVAFAATSAAVVGAAKLLVSRRLNPVRPAKPGDLAVDQNAVA